jgi:hypothetical protein
MTIARDVTICGLYYKHDYEHVTDDLQSHQ